MSCNKENINRLSTITISAHQLGRVTGQLKRLTGSKGFITAIPDRGYKFDGWFDTDSQLITDDDKLTILSWSDMTVEPRFSEIIITVNETSPMDANETLMYYIEHHGQNEGVITYDLKSTYYSAGNFSSSATGAQFRLKLDGSKFCLQPVTYGYNYGQVDVDEDGNPINDIGAATYDETTNTITGQWYRRPDTYETKTEFSVPKVLTAPRATMPFPTAQGYRGGTTDCETNTTTSWNVPAFGTYNSPTDGSTPSQFPLLQYHQGVYIRNTSHQEWFDPAGLEGGDFQQYYLRIQKEFRTIDAMSEWKDFRILTAYNNDYKMFNTNTIGKTTDDSPRILDPLAYCNNLSTVHPTNLRDTNSNPRQSSDINTNPQWMSSYQSRPQAGSFLNPLRHSMITSLTLPRYTKVTDLSMINNYFKSLHGLYYYQSTQSSVDVDISNINMRKFTGFFWNANDFVLTLESLTDASKLTRLYLQPSGQYKILTLEPLLNKKLKYVHTGPFLNLIHDSLYEETVKLHMNFNSSNILTQDSTRHVNKLNNYGATVTTT